MTTDTSIDTESILLVDDNPTNLKLTRFLLVSEGYRVITAEDGLQAIAILQETRPDLVLMDVQLPGTDGLEITRRLRAEPATRDLKIVALTAYAMKGDEDKAREAGCDGYIAKPIDTRTFPNLVRKYLDQGGARQPAATVGCGVSRILLAEDNAVQRKLLEIRLSEAGFSVTGASDGAEALEIARRDRPDMVISDVLMPRLDGFRLCEAIRSDPNLGNTHVILTTSGSVQEADRTLAEGKGATALLHKTEDGQGLLESIRKASSAAPIPMRQEPIGQLEPLRQRFLKEGQEQLQTLLRSDPEDWDRQAAAQFAHRWAGTGGSLGFPQISQTAFHLEGLLETDILDNGAIEKALTQLKRLFHQGRQEDVEHPVPEQVRQALRARTFAVIGFPRDEARRIAKSLEAVGGFTRVLEKMPSETVSNLLIVDADNRGGEFSLGDALRYPTLLVGTAERLSALKKIGNIDFLVAPAETSEILLRSYHLLTRATSGSPTGARAQKNAPRILIADDDPTIIALLEATLGHAAMDCYTASTGGEAIRRAQELAFDAIVLDVNIPEKDGFEVLAELKSTSHTQSIPVIMLTGRQQETDILRAFALGAGDYVTKPFSPMEVVARLERFLKQ